MVVVLACGCFDPLHPGHLYHLLAAKRLGTHLVVAVTGDRYVNKPNRPIFPDRERALLVQELRCVDAVFISKGAEEAIELIRPHVYVKGKEYEGRLPEQTLVESFGGKVVYTDQPVYSSTGLVTGEYFRAQRASGGGCNP